MSENENQQSTIAANLCKNGCGFYGSTQFDGMCSVCHKDTMKKRQKQDEDQIQKPTASPHAAALLCTSSTLQQSVAAFGSDQPQPQQQPQQIGVSSEADNVQGPFCAAAAASVASTEPSVASSLAVTASCLAELTSVSSDLSASTSSAGTADSAQSSSQSKKRARCGMCKKKVGLTGFGCRCGGIFCSLHRYSDKHDCQFDYQSHGQAEIRKANPQVVSSKIEKL